jgi:hypothetical protein
MSDDDEGEAFNWYGSHLKEIDYLRQINDKLQHIYERLAAIRQCVEYTAIAAILIFIALSFGLLGPHHS